MQQQKQQQQQQKNNATFTMKEVLASIPGFTMKSTPRNNKKTSTQAKIEKIRSGCIDLVTPDSILVATNLRAVLTKLTFSNLPPLYQYKLEQLLPSVDRSVFGAGDSVLTNEYFARACQEWQERLGEGEFTPKNQLKLKAEADRDKSELDPWKVKHFEPMWGEKCSTTPQQQHSASTIYKTKTVAVATCTASSSAATIRTATTAVNDNDNAAYNNRGIMIEGFNCKKVATTIKSTTSPSTSVENTCNNVEKQFMATLKRSISPKDDGTPESSSNKYLKWR